METEEIELSYCGLLDGKKMRVRVGAQWVAVPDPSFRPEPRFEENPPITPVAIPVMKFVRRPYTNVFVLSR